MNKELYYFYTRKGTNQEGLTFDEIIQYNPEQLEAHHDYIQWILPTLTASACVEGSPVLDEETITALIGNDVFRKRYHDALIMMLRFWGIEFDVLTLKLKPIEGERFWASPLNHNQRRLARFMESASLLRYKDVAEDLFACLLTYSQTEAGYSISATNIFYWFKAFNKI